jgi:outer membrane protein OmpA-like peptidoglycan-associated protein/cell wall-associated NlpC family hydrolase
MKRPPIVLGLLLTVAVETGCHGHAVLELPESPHHAPIYSDGPVPLPGQDFHIPHVLGTDGQPLVVPSVPPGSLMSFPRPEARPPGQILVRRHPAEVAGAGIATVAQGQTLAIEPVLLLTSGPPIQSVVGFEVPQLPEGIYDVWYVGGQPGGGARSLLAPGAPEASQWTTLEIRPQLRAAKSVVHGLPGTIVNVAIGFYGPMPTGNPIGVTLTGFNEAVRLAPGQTDKAFVGSDGLARFRLRVELESDVYLAAIANGFAAVAVRVVGGPEYPLRDHRLRPGDVLLCQGETPILSPGIQWMEENQLGKRNRLGRPWYSHVALYLGNEETAEMLFLGLRFRNLEDTVDGCTTLDVYRRDGITQAEQDSVVEKAKSHGIVPYAFGQIAAMGSMAVTAYIADESRVRLDGSDSWLDRLVADVAVASDWAMRTFVTFVRDGNGGPWAMICSEFVAWSYHDGGVSLAIERWWPVVEKAGLTASLDGRMDFTTPNMIAQSPDLSFQFQLFPKEPPKIEVANCQVRLGEKIEFATGSAAVSKDDEDLLKRIATVLASHPEIHRLRVEGNTDDVGTPQDNLRLSQDRAGAVVSWLVMNGVDPSRLSSVGIGESRPLVPNDTAGHRHKNRRVEFHVESQTCQPEAAAQ